MKPQQGQATVELVLVLPLVVVLVLGVAQVAIVGADQVRVVDASRAAARAAAVDDDPEAPIRAVIAGGLPRSQVSVVVERGDGMVAAKVDLRISTALPLVGAWIRDTMLTARTTVHEERPPGGLPP